MTSIEHDNEESLADFLAKLDLATTTEPLTVGFAVIGLTNFGERPVRSARLAEVVGWPVSEAQALLRQGMFGTRVEDGLITVSPERARSAPRRQVQTGPPVRGDRLRARHLPLRAAGPPIPAGAGDLPGDRSARCTRRTLGP